MASRENTDYLRFNAFAIKDLITRKLAQDSNYTDQIYPGSNLNILIDIVSYMYQTLMYNLNSAASESMWSDTKIYENINRLCNFLGYNPHGMNPAAAIFSIPLEQFRSAGLQASQYNAVIPRYSYIDTGKLDSTGKRVFYSTVEDISIHADSTSNTQEITLYNGRWRLYNTIFTAEGTDWETFTLNGLRSDASTNDFVANNYIHVYVKSPTTEDGTYHIQRYNMTDGGLFKSRNEYFSHDDGEEVPIPKIYSPNDFVFNLRLDETKTYAITFGNNRQGHRLEKGSSIYIFYLDSNGPGADLALNEVNGVLKQDFASYRSSTDGVFYENIYKLVLGIKNTELNQSWILDGVSNVTNVSRNIVFSPEENVDQIRDFAPNWFRMGNRLVTQRDYEYFLNNSPAFRETFADIKCMNNWGYMSTFYKWLYEMGKKFHEEIDPSDTLGGRRFLKQDNILKTTRQYADPADSNNIYLWFVPNQSGELQEDDISVWKPNAERWKEALLSIKDLTHEPYFVPCILTKFAICANPDYKYIRDNYFNLPKISDSSMFNENYIEITISDEIVYANSTIQKQVQTIVYNFFRSENFKLGQYVDFNELQNQIFAINGVNRIRTVFKPLDDTVPAIVRNGLCFASWTDDEILKVRNKLEGIDLDVSSAGRSLEPFQFPRLVSKVDEIKVVVIKRSAASFNTVAY